MKVSIDIGTKNFGVFIMDNQNTPKSVHNFDLRPYCLKNICQTLDGLNIPTDEDNIILVEKQLHKNFNACMISAHIEMYFYLKFPDTSLVSKNTTKVIFCNSKCKSIKRTPTYKHRKNNSVTQAENYLKSYEDLLVEFNKYKKKDDIADAITQMLFHLKINT